MTNVNISKRKYPFGTITKIVSARIPIYLVEKISKLCRCTGRSKSDVLTQIIDSYFENNNQ